MRPSLFSSCSQRTEEGEVQEWSKRDSCSPQRPDCPRTGPAGPSQPPSVPLRPPQSPLHICSAVLVLRGWHVHLSVSEQRRPEEQGGVPQGCMKTPRLEPGPPPTALLGLTPSGRRPVQAKTWSLGWLPAMSPALGLGPRDSQLFVHEAIHCQRRQVSIQDSSPWA